MCYHSTKQNMYRHLWRGDLLFTLYTFIVMRRIAYYASFSFLFVHFLGMFKCVRTQTRHIQKKTHLHSHWRIFHFSIICTKNYISHIFQFVQQFFFFVQYLSAYCHLTFCIWYLLMSRMISKFLWRFD